MKNSIKFVKAPALALLATILTTSTIMSAYADNPPAKAKPAAIVNSTATSQASPQTANLGKINVKAMRALVQTLQMVKVALKTPYSDDRNAVVCSINSGRGAATLECGSNSFYMDRRDSCHFGVMVREVSCSDLGTSSFTWGGHDQFHDWHSVRTLSQQQLMHLRELLKQLPPPGQGDVAVVDYKGNVMVTVTANASSATAGKN